jgi:hypothetical protein
MACEYAGYEITKSMRRVDHRIEKFIPGREQLLA